ncbi:MAG: DUF6184 family natural product biosynthesis lipoprotein [Polyangiaceae bacterium]
MLRPALLLLAFPLLALGCEETTPAARQPVPGTDHAPLAGPSASPDMGVIDHLSEATCDREQTCGTIGPGADFASREQCLRSMRDKLGPKLSFSQCPGGIDRAAVDTCVTSLRATECTQPGDTITRSARCATADLCMK